MVTDVRHFGQDLLVIEPSPPAPEAQAGGPGGRAAPRPGTLRGPAGRAPPWRPGGPAAGTPEELLVPFVAAIVPEVDVAGRPPGHRPAARACSNWAGIRGARAAAHRPQEVR